MTIREEYEYLKTELMVMLHDTTVMCKLDFPFEFKISKKEEDRYFMRGFKTRLATKKSMIILDNTYRKIRLFPSAEMAKIFEETVDGILKDFKKDVMDAFMDEKWRFRDDDYDSYAKYIDSLTSKIKNAAKPYAKKIKSLKQEDIEREINEKDTIKRTQQEEVHATIDKNNRKGLF